MWFRVDAEINQSPEVISLGKDADLACWLYMRMAAFSSLNLSDGIITDREIAVIEPSRKRRNRALHALEKSKMISRMGPDWELIWTLTRLPTLSQTEQAKLSNRTRQARIRGNRAKRNGVSNGVSNATQDRDNDNERSAAAAILHESDIPDFSTPEENKTVLPTPTTNNAALRPAAQVLDLTRKLSVVVGGGQKSLDFPALKFRITTQWRWRLGSKWVSALEDACPISEALVDHVYDELIADAGSEANGGLYASRLLAAISAPPPSLARVPQRKQQQQDVTRGYARAASADSFGESGEIIP
jgi:hypothetical protein